MSWKKTKIGEFLFERKGLIDPNSRELFSFKKIEKIDFSEGKIFLCDYSPTKTKQIIVRKGDFVFSGLNIEKGAVAVNDFDQDLVVSANYSTCEVDYSKIDSEFLKFFIKSSFFKRLLTDNLKKDYGFTRPKHLVNLEVFLPSIEEQKKIAEKLKHSEEKQKLLKQEIDNQKNYIKNLGKQILQDAIEGKLTKEWREQNSDIEPASELLKKIKKEKEKLIAEKKIKKEKLLPAINESEIPFEVPKSWVWTRLGEIGIFERGKSKHRPRNDQSLFKDGSIPFIQTGDVAQSKKTGRQILNCKTYYNEFGLKQSKLWDVGTLCITIAANIAETGFLSMKACFPDSIIGFKPLSDNAISKYVQFFIEISREGIEKYAPATAQKNINLEIISLLLIPTPPPAEQQAIVSKLKTLMQKLDEAEKQIEKSLKTSKLLTKAILAEAFNGHE
jgi:type I restriction enzyme S subunit